MTAFNSAVSPGSGNIIQQAMAQRGVIPSGSPAAQMTPGTPMANPMPVPSAPPPMNAGGNVGLPPHPVMNQPPQGMQPAQPQAPQKPALPMTQENIIIQALIKQLERLDTNKKMPGIQLPPGLGE
jgi:hypothetical protein